MQLYAFDSFQKLIHALCADRGEDYFCPECKGVVHRRGGLHRQDHFYHLDLNRACRQSGKSAAHLQVQCFFLKTLPPDECCLERPFPAIGRIADVYWEKEKIVFEVQCSPISHEEVIARNRDYASIGICTVWILHDARYKKRNLSAAESILANSPHYFTNIDENGSGVVYDLFSIVHRGKRIHTSAPLQIDVKLPQRVDTIEVPCIWKLIQHRCRQWRMYFSGDLCDNYLKGDLQGYCSSAQSAEQEFYALSDEPAARKGFFEVCLEPFRVLLQLFLELSCK